MKSTLICEGADNIVFASGADVSVKIDFVGLNVTLLKGWIGESYTIASDTIVNKLPKNLFKSKTRENNDLYFQGAMDIVAQQLSEDFERKKKIRNIVFSTTKIETSRKKSAEEKEGYLTYSMYFEYNETAKDSREIGRASCRERV